ncbi:MAG: dihydroneopterin aldolase [Dysgonomonas sp.]
MKSFILLENIEIYARHGVFNQETLVGNTFIINLKAEVDCEAACLNDDLNATVDYGEIYRVVEEEMATPSKLLEHVAYRIVKRLKSEFKQIKTVELKISKLNPPIKGQIDCASVLLYD